MKIKYGFDYMNTSLISSFFVVSFSFLCFGEKTPLPANGTLKRSAEQGLKNDLTLLGADAKREAAKEGVLQAQSARWPTIGLTASGSSTIGQKKSVQRYIPTNGTYGRYPTQGRTISQQASAGVELKQKLYTGGEIDAGVKVAKLSDVLEETRYENAQNASIFSVIKSVLTVLETRALVKVAERKKDLLVKRAENMQIRADYGLENITSLESTKAQAEEAKAELAAQETALDIAEKSYEILTGESLPESLEDIAPSALPASFELIREIGLAQSPTLQEKKLAADIAEQQVVGAEASLAPNLSLSLSGGRSWTSTHGGSTTGKIDWTRTNSATLTLNLSVPIDYTGALHSQVRGKKYAHAQARLDEMNTRRQFVLKLFDVWSQYKTATANLDKHQAQIKAADLSLEAVQEQYNAGTAGYLDVLEAIARAAQANTAFIRSKKNSLEKSYEILYFIGKLPEAFKSEVEQADLPQKGETPYLDMSIKEYGAFGWKNDPLLDRINSKPKAEDNKGDNGAV